MTIKSFFPLLFILFSTNLVGRDLYWIGESGNWNNPNNWSLTSGGSPVNSVPSESDDVFFDGNSFSKKNGVVQFEEISLKSITINNSTGPVFVGKSLTISEALEFSSNLVFNANLIFESDTKEENIINTGGYEISSNVKITAGHWVLKNHLLLADSKTLEISSKSFNSNGFSIKATDIFAQNVKLQLENSTIYPLKHIDLDRATRKGDGFTMVEGASKNNINLGQYAGLIVTKGASTCGSLSLTSTITSNYNGQSISCAGACDGELTVSASGTAGPYSYQLLYFGFVGPITSNTVYTGLCPATYTIKVLDSSNVIGPGIYGSCTVDEPISQPSVLTMNIDGFINPTCHDVCDGQAFVSVSGGTGAKTLVWDNGETGTITDSMCVGDNIVTISDVNNCTIQDTLVINSPDIMDFDVTITLPTCSGDSDAELLLSNETGGNGGPYGYSFSPAPTSGQNTNNGIGFSSGIVTVTITDIDGCGQDSIVTIIDPPVLTILTADLMDLSCFGVCNGQVSALPNGGAPGYSFEWFDNNTGLTTGITDSIATGLCAGDYYVVVTDANGCVKTSAAATIDEPIPFSLNVTNTDVACLDSCTGIVTASPVGGVPGYTFSWIDISTNLSVGTTASVSSLCAGLYEITVTDANTCVSEPDTVEVLNGLPLDVVFTSTAPACYDICDGEITVTPTNQTGFLYSWSNGGNTATITGLCVVGQYIATVTSDSGCVEIDTFSFAAPVQFDIVSSQTDLLCFGDADANIVVDVIEGGNGPVFTYDWTVIASPGDAINGDFTDSIFSLTAQDYQVIITDGPGGCDTTLTFTITSAPELTVTAVNPVDLLCADICTGELSALPVGGTLPYTYEWFDNLTGLTTGITDSTATGLCEGSYYVVVTDGNNCTVTSAVLLIDSPLPMTIALSKVDLICIDICDGEVSSVVTGGTLNYNYTWINLATMLTVGTTSVVTGLCPGDYELTVVDANNCPSVIDTISVLNALPIGINLLGTDPTCYNSCDGEIDVTTTNSSGFSYVWTPAPISGQGTDNVTSLCASINYVVEVTDVNGCIEKDSLILNSVPQYDIISSVTDVNCFGAGNGAISITVNSGGNGVPYSFVWTSVNGDPFTGQGTSNITGLIQGDYTVTVGDALSCDTTLNFSVISPPELFVNTTDIMQISCFGLCDGQISGLPSGGNPGYVFEWIDNATGLVFSNDSIAENLCIGDFYIRVTDANGCIDSSGIITIIEPTPLVINASANDISCNNICDGSAQVSVSGGTAGYVYTWTNITTNGNVGNTDSLTGLCPGEYQIIITDANGTGCISEPDTVEVLDVLPFSITIAGTSPNCTNTCNGTISGTAVNGFAPYTWSPIPSVGQNTAMATYNNLCEGFYNISVVDNNGCIAGDTITLNSPTPYDITVTEIDLNCFNDNSGSISVLVNSGGNGGVYTYSWLPVGLTGAGTNTVSNLNPGPYQVVISDGTCDTTLMFTIDEPTELIIDASIISNSLCEGDCNGSGQVTITGGTPTYSVLWDDPLMQGTGLIANLCPDIYHVTVTDFNGCVKIDSIAITESTGFIFTTVTTDVNCFGACDGSATISNLSGGAPGYTVLWDDPNNQTTLTATNLCAGDYQVTITDINNCDTTVTVTIIEPAALGYTIEVTDTACFGSCDGVLSATATGGSTPFDFEWYNVNSTVNIGSGSPLSGLCPGSYYAEVSDVNGCIVLTDTVDITEFPQIVLATTNITNASCGLSDGAITISASGGAGNFLYNWTPGVITGQGTSSISQISNGLYQAIVTDGNSCTDSISVPISSGAQEILNTSSTDVSCFGLSDGTIDVNFICLEPNCGIEWFNEAGNSLGSTNLVTGLGAGIYYVELTNGLGCTVIDSIIVAEPVEIIATISSTDILCNGGDNGTATVTTALNNLLYNWIPAPNGGQGTNAATGLTPGLWDVEVSDVGGCILLLSTVIDESPAIIINNISGNDISCAGIDDGSVSISANGGTPTLVYNWFTCGSGLPVGSGSFVGSLPPGDYFVVITDGNNCVLNSNCVTIGDKSPITAINTTSNASCFGECNGNIVSSVSGGNGVYFYQWKDGNQVDIIGQTNLSISNLCQGSYYLEVTDGSGCSELFGPIDLTQPIAPWDVSFTISDVSCFNDCDGTGLITVNAGNTAPYNYSWNDPLNQSTAQGINLCAGSYEVMITDQGNCDTTVTVLIGNALPILTNGVQTNILCADDCTGAVTLTPSGGQIPYGITWTNGDIGVTASNICVGAITASILDDAGCTIDTTFIITEPLNPISIISTFQNITQCNLCNGSATVNVSGGTAPYTYVWSEPTVAGQGSNSVTGLCAGFISVTVTDGNGCELVQSFLIQDLDGDDFSLASTDASCFDICDGTAAINPTCTVPLCTQAWYNAITGAQLTGTGLSISNLCQGDYIVELTNGAGCVSGDTFSIASPNELFIDEIITNVTCSGDNDGSIIVTPSGGSGGGYVYVWTPAPPNGNGTNTATGLSSGAIDLQVTDSDNCIIQDSYTIIDTTPIVLATVSNNVLCNSSCNGNITVTASGGYGNYTYQWLNNGTPIAGETSAAIFDLCPGNYNVIVTDGNGCLKTLINAIIITEPTQVGASLTDTDISCFGLCDGTATVAGSGGVGTYVYNWYNSANNLIGQSTATATALCADDYYVVITDTNNCSVTTSLTAVTEPSEIIQSVSQIDIDCFSDCNASAAMTINGGMPTYVFEWKNTVTNAVIGNSSSITNLCAGSYTIEAIDMNGCSTGIIDVNFISPGELIVDVFANNADCNVASGSATAQVSGGIPLYSYHWLDINQAAIVGETSNMLENVFSGTYFVVVADANSCDDTVQVIIEDNPSTTIQFDEVNNPTCFGSSDGSIEISIVGNNLPLNFLWNPGGLVVEDPANLIAGAYNLTVTDALGCESFYDTVLVEPTEIVTTPTFTDPTCGLCDGAVSVTVTGGVNPYNYAWSNGANTNNIQNLCAGIYELTIEDDNGCELVSPFALGNSAAVTAEALVTPISCFDLCDGEITVNILTGTAPYNVVWLNDGFTGLTQQNLCADTYFIEVTDAAGCIFPLVVELENPNEIFVTSSMSLPTCGLSDGGISVSSIGGVLPHVYSWSTNESTPAIVNLGAGVFNLTVTDDNGTGCSQDFTFNLSNITVPQVSLTTADIDCNGSCNGEIISTTTGGTPNYGYQWFTGAGSLVVGETTPNLLNLCAGEYTIEVSDANGCLAYATENISEPTEVIFNSPIIENVNCFGDCDGSISVNSFGGTLPYSYLWDDPNSQTNFVANNLCDGIYTLTLTDGNNCQIIFVDSIVQPELLEIAIDTIIQAQCKETIDGEIQVTITGGTLNYAINWLTSTGLTFDTEDLIGVLPMNYYLTVTDANGCIAQDTAIIDTAVVVFVDAGLDTVICNLNEANLIAISNQIAADYTWLSESASVVSDSNIYLTGILEEGIYTFIAQATYDGCDDFDTVSITVNSPLIVDAGPDIEILINDSGIIGGNPTSAESGQFIWTPSLYLSDTSASNPNIIKPQEDGWYFVEFIDSLGCRAIDSMYVEIIPELTVPEGISPNNDGKNDTWVIEFRDDFPNLEVSVYSRWGELLFYDNSGYLTPWDGKYKNKELPVGTYYYVIELNSELYPEPFVGPLTIMR